MCEWGDTVPVKVLIPAELSHTGADRIAVKPIDSCIAPLVRTFQEYGIWTVGSCCGHGGAPGWIMLHDGRRLTITAKCAAPAGGEEKLERCDTTLAPRHPREYCTCGDEIDGMGPCLTWELGASGRCVYCEHTQFCHAVAGGEENDGESVETLATRREDGRGDSPAHEPAGTAPDKAGASVGSPVPPTTTTEEDDA